MKMLTQHNIRNVQHGEILLLGLGPIRPTPQVYQTCQGGEESLYPEDQQVNGDHGVI